MAQAKQRRTPKAKSREPAVTDLATALGLAHATAYARYLDVEHREGATRAEVLCARAVYRGQVTTLHEVARRAGVPDTP